MPASFNRSIFAFCVIVALFAESAYGQRGATGQKPSETTVKPDLKKTLAVNTDAEALADFKKRIDAYVEIHNKAADDVPPLKETTDPAEITRAQTALETRIRELRADAKAGDIFTPAIRVVFRRILRPELKGEDGRDAKEVLKDDAPANVPMKVNAKYPAGATLPTVPASLLESLPTLPEELEYRIIDRHLILRDTRAGIIADFIPNAIN